MLASHLLSKSYSIPSHSITAEEELLSAADFDSLTLLTQKMASRFSNAKIVTSFIANTVCPVVTRRGYAAASQSAAASSVRGGAVAPNMMLKKGNDESKKTSWVPDPVTGYYRPENEAKEIDAAELRAQLLKNTTSSH